MSDPNALSDTHMLAHLLKDYWPIILSSIGFIVSILIVVKGKIPYLEKEINDANNKIKLLQDSRFVKEQVLFDKNNQFKFQTVPMCSQVRDECHSQQKIFQENFCRKLDTITLELKGIVNDADRKREETRYEITAMNKQLIELMTQMKTILARDRREEVSDMVQIVVKQVLKQMKDR